MNTEPVKVSVIVAAYNAAQTIDECLYSLCRQSLRDIEVIVVDDCSADQTSALVARWVQKDSRVRLIRQEKNGGPAAARNAGLEAASGEWIAIVDSDDTIHPDRLAKMVDVGEKQGVDIVFDNISWLREGELEQDKSFSYVSPQLDVFGPLSMAAYALSHLRGSRVPSLGFLKPLLRADLLHKHHIRYNPALRLSEDSLLILTLFSYGAKAVLLPDAYYLYRRRVGSLSYGFGLDKMRSFDRAFTGLMEEAWTRLSPADAAALKILVEYNRRRMLARETAENLVEGRWVAAWTALRSGRVVLKYFVRDLASMAKKFLRSCGKTS